MGRRLCRRLGGRDTEKVSLAYLSPSHGVVPPPCQPPRQRGQRDSSDFQYLHRRKSSCNPTSRRAWKTTGFERPFVRFAIFPRTAGNHPRQRGQRVSTDFILSAPPETAGQPAAVSHGGESRLSARRGQRYTIIYIMHVGRTVRRAAGQKGTVRQTVGRKRTAAGDERPFPRWRAGILRRAVRRRAA